MNKTAIYGYQPSDRNIVIITEYNQLIGVNFWQGMGDMSIAESFLTPDFGLTEYVLSYIDDKLHNAMVVDLDSCQLKHIDDAIWSYVDLSNERKIKLPTSQRILIKEAVEFYYNVLKKVRETDDDFKEIDLLRLSAFLSYDVTITITERDVERFTANHGVDFPEYAL